MNERSGSKVVIVTQARVGSTRLPGKVMKVSAGKSLLGHHLERIARSRLADAVVVATTDKDDDLPIVELSRAMGLEVFRGPEKDVLARYVGAARHSDADIVVRVTSDCPLIDPAVIDRTIEAFLGRRADVDYVSNRLIPTYPRGMDTEVLPRSVLELAHAEASNPEDREHVTLFVWRQPSRFRLHNVAYSSDQSRHRWTVDTAADFELIDRMLLVLHKERPWFNLEDCLECLRQNPAWIAINAHVEQKPISIARE